MTLSDLASIGSFVSGVAVVFSFIFLSFQIRQSNLNQRALMQQGRSARVVESLFHSMEPHLSEISARGRSGDLSMDDSQVSLFLQLCTTTYVNWEDSYLQHQAGTIDPDAWATDEVRMRLWLSVPAYRASWSFARNWFSGGYRDFVDSVMRDAKVAPLQSGVSQWKQQVGQETVAN